MATRPAAPSAIFRSLLAIVALPLLSSCVVAAGSSREGSGSSFLVLFLPIAGVVVLMMLARRAVRGPRRGRPARSHDVDDGVSSPVLRAELSVLADDVLRLEPLVALNEEARDDFESATHRYRVAHAAVDQAEAPADLRRVQRVVDEANWSMGRARAIVEGREPPSPPPSLQHPGPQGEPAVDVDERHRPVYVDSTAPFRSGWFAVGGGLLGGALLGGIGSAWIDDVVDDHDDGPADDSSW